MVKNFGISCLVSNIWAFQKWKSWIRHAKNQFKFAEMTNLIPDFQWIYMNLLWIAMHVIAGESSCNLCYVLSISTVCWNSLKSLGHLERNWAHHGTDTGAFLLLHSLYCQCFFLNFCLWQSSTHRDLNLNMNIQLILFEAIKDMADVLVWHMGRWLHGQWFYLLYSLHLKLALWF